MQAAYIAYWVWLTQLFTVLFQIDNWVNYAFRKNRYTGGICLYEQCLTFFFLKARSEPDKKNTHTHLSVIYIATFTKGACLTYGVVYVFDKIIKKKQWHCARHSQENSSRKGKEPAALGKTSMHSMVSSTHLLCLAIVMYQSQLEWKFLAN